MFICLPQDLASQKERRQLLIILRVLNIIFSEFLLLSFYFFILDARRLAPSKIYKLLKVCFDQRTSLDVFSS